MFVVGGTAWCAFSFIFCSRCRPSLTVMKHFVHLADDMHDEVQIICLSLLKHTR